MFFDFTGVSIIIALTLAFACLAFSHFKNRNFFAKNAAEVFLSILFGSIAVQIIFAALKGDTESLPSSWRIYLAIGGAVVVFKACRKLLKALARLKKK